MTRQKQLLCCCAIFVTLLACAPRPSSDVLKPLARAPSYTKKADILVATTRERGSAEDPHALTAARARSLNFEALTVSVPTHHVPGEIEWPDQIPPDPSRHFVTTDRRFLKQSSFLSQIQERVHANGPEANRVLIFVHGYNMLYQESVYWLAQIVHDAGFKGTAVLFAWPSQGKAPLYIADREASTYSRDYLEQALLQISALPEVREISILAHSMGNWLTVETLRQAKMKGHADFNGKLGEVILASPDLDVNVFRTQLDTIGELPRPMTILVSGDDKALALSSKLAGGADRGGLITASDLRAVEGAKHYNLRVVDLTAVEDGHGNNHSKFARSSAVIAAIGRGLEAKSVDAKAQGVVVSAVTEVGQSIAKIPAAILGGAIAQ